jgi:hypothetical protein
MGDRAELDVVVSSQVDRLLAGMSSMERSLVTIEKAHGTAAVAATQQASTLTQLEGRVGSITGTIGKLTGVFTSLFVAFEGIKHGFEAFDSLEKHNIDLLRTTEILGGNGQAASAWSVIANEMGLSLDTIDRGFAKLATDMNAAANPALKQMGITAEDARGKLRPLNDVIGDVADYMHRHAGAANLSALANQLFGRSGYELLPILEQGRAGIAAITDEARKYGLILDATTIERNAAFTFQLREAQMAGEGLAVSLGNALLPGLAAVGQAFSKVVSDNLPAFIAGVNRAVSYIIGFVEGLTGMKLAVGEGAMALSNLGSISGDTGTGLDKAAGASHALADAIEKVRDRTKDATDAIDRQIASLNAQMAAERFADQQAKLQQDIANKAHDIDNLRQQQYEQFWLGNFAAAQSIGDQITKDQQDQANLQNQITQASEDQQTQAKITSLEKQKQSLQDAIQKQIDAMQKAGQAEAAAFGGAIDSIIPHVSKTGKTAGETFAQQMAAAAGADAGKQLQDAIFGKDTVDHFGRHARLGGAGLIGIGQAMGEAIGSGLTTALGQSFKTWLTNAAKNILKAESNPKWSTLSFDAKLTELTNFLGFDRGGMVPGRIGEPRLAVVHGGEEVRTPAQQASGMNETNAILREQNQLLRQLVAGSGGGSTTGGLAALSNLIDDANRSRARGMAGS